MSMCSESIQNHGSEENFVYRDRKCWNCNRLGWSGVYESNDNVSCVTILCIKCGQKKFTNYCSADQLNKMKRAQMIQHIKERYPARYYYILETYCDGDPDKFDCRKFTPE